MNHLTKHLHPDVKVSAMDLVLSRIPPAEPAPEVHADIDTDAVLTEVAGRWLERAREAARDVSGAETLAALDFDVWRTMTGETVSAPISPVTPGVKDDASDEQLLSERLERLIASNCKSRQAILLSLGEFSVEWDGDLLCLAALRVRKDNSDKVVVFFRDGDIRVKGSAGLRLTFAEAARDAGWLDAPSAETDTRTPEQICAEALRDCVERGDTEPFDLRIGGQSYRVRWDGGQSCAWLVFDSEVDANLFSFIGGKLNKFQSYEHY